MTRLHSPSCHSVSVKWQQLNLDAPEPLQAPAQVPSLFHNDRLLVYGFIPHCTQATLCALIDEKEFQAMVSTTELQKTTGTMIHKLTARALIRDYEDGILHENETRHEMKKQSLKSLIVKLSKENSLITQFTSFVAVEKRDGNELPFPNIPNISKLIAEEDVDFLPYMNWQEKQPGASTAQRLPSVSAWDEEVQPKYLVKKKLKRQTMEEAVSDSQAAAEPLTPYLVYGDLEMSLDLGVMDALQQPDRGVPEHAVVYSSPVGLAASDDSALALPPPLYDASSPSCMGPQVLASKRIASSFPSAAAAGGSSPFPPLSALPNTFSFSDEGPIAIAPRFPPAAAAGGSSFSPPPPPLPDASSSSRTCLQGPLFGSSFSFGSLSPFKHSDRPNDSQGKQTSRVLRSESSPSLLRRIPIRRSSPLGSKRSAQSELPEPLRAQSTRPYAKTASRMSASPGPHSLFSCQGPSVGPTSPRRPSSSPRSPSLGTRSLSVYCAPSFGSPALSAHQRPLLSSLPARAAPSGSPTAGLCADGSSVGKDSDAFADIPVSAVFADADVLMSCESFDVEDQAEEIETDFSLPLPCLTNERKKEQRDFQAGERGEAVVQEQSRRRAATYPELFSLQTEDGFWKLTPNLGFILNFNTNVLLSFLEQKGIRSLGVNGRECLLNLIATLLVLQFLRTKLEQEGIVLKSLMKLDVPSVCSHIPWAFEKIKRASEWVRRTEGQYSSICQRLELGKDWDSATKQLLGIQPTDPASPLHKALNQSQSQ